MSFSIIRYNDENYKDSWASQAVARSSFQKPPAFPTRLPTHSRVKKRQFFNLLFSTLVPFTLTSLAAAQTDAVVAVGSLILAECLEEFLLILH